MLGFKVSAATLHATHYHETDVFAVQNQIMNSDHESYIDDLLNIPVSDGQNWSNEEINKEIENNARNFRICCSMDRPRCRLF